MILFTADIHLKLGQKNVPKDWALNRYRLFFDMVHGLEEDVDLHIIGGDLFDRVPSMEELELYFEFIEGVTKETFIISGNHEATKKGKSFLTNLKQATKAINPLVTIIDFVLETEKYYLVPYEFIHKKETWTNLNKSKAVFSHIRGEIPPHVTPEINLELIRDFPVVFVGDLHSHSNCQANMVYPGSPMATSFHRAPISTGYLLIDGDDLTTWQWHEFKLPQLLRRTVSDAEHMVPTYPDHTIYELEGDVVELGQVKSTELLDKKLVKRSSDSALLLHKDMTIEDELIEYLTYIVELPEPRIKEVISVFHDYASKAQVG